MVRGNAEQEARAVEPAQLVAGERVLVVGHGPGVGLVQAAAAVTPGGQVVALDPSPLMRDLAATRCAAPIAAGVVEIRAGTAENTGCLGRLRLRRPVGQQRDAVGPADGVRGDVPRS